MNKKSIKILMRLSRAGVLLLLLSMTFYIIRKLGHEAFEVGILYEGSIMVQYEVEEECVLDAIAALAALVLPMFYLVLQKEHLERMAVRDTRARQKRNASAFLVVDCSPHSKHIINPVSLTKKRQC